MIKGSIKEEDITIVNIYAPNIRAPQYIRQTIADIKGEIDSNTIIVGDFNTPLTPMDRSSKQKINKETQVLNDTLHEMNLIDIFRTFHPNAEEYNFFLSAHGTFSRIDHIIGHKSNLSKFKKIEIISSIFSDHNTMRLDINYKKKTIRNTNTWRLNNTFLNNQQVTEEIKREIKKISRNKWQWKHDNSKPIWYSKGSAKRKVYSHTILPQKNKKNINRQPNFTPKTTEKRRIKEPPN